MLTLEEAPAVDDRSSRVNAALLRRVMLHIKANPHAWDQDEWLKQHHECGTIACLAGWTYVLATGRTDLPTAAEADIGPIAQCWLGFNDAQAEELFWLTDVHDAVSGENRHPTFAEFAARVTAATGVDLKDIVGAD